MTMTEEESQRSDCHNYRFVIQDTGIGMSQEFVEKIFEPFERELNDTTSRTEGVGLGMPIAKNIIDMMGGTIKIESEPHIGTTVTVVIPLKPADESNEELDLSELKGVSILVVDDDASVLESTQLILDDIGLRGVTAKSGIEAIALTVAAHKAKDDFRAIIIDWIMPGMDGIETIRQIREEVGESTPIILMTAYDWSEIEDEAKEAGVTAFISKPLFKSRLCQALKILCRNKDEVKASAQKKLENQTVQGRVLLVEDNELNREIAVELMQQIGAEVEEACDGQEAIDMLKSAPDSYYDLIFMDIQMPRMGGMEATERICKLFTEEGRVRPTIIAMTANAFNEDREKALNAGMDGFMTKPINYDELKHTLVTHLSVPRKN